jgi:hypothetical protein
LSFYQFNDLDADWQSKYCVILVRHSVFIFTETEGRVSARANRRRQFNRGDGPAENGEVIRLKMITNLDKVGG